MSSFRSDAALTAAVLLIGGCGPFGGHDSAGGGGGGGGGGKGPRAVAQGFLDEWSAARYAEASGRTTDPAAALKALNDMQDSLKVAKRTFAPGDMSGNCDSTSGCRMDFDVDLQLTGLGEWRYASALQIVKTVGTGYQVRWAPSILHPQMTETTKFSRVRQLPPRAPILDRNDQPLVTQQPVVRVGVRAGDVPDGTIEALAEKTNVNVDGLLTRTANADDGKFVEAVVLRVSDYNALKPELDAIKGLVIEQDQLTLAPSREFAREVLGSVGNATPAALSNAGPTASDEDSVGLFGLQGLYQKQLAGRAGGRIDLVNAATGAPIETLIEFTSVPGTPVHTTLDMKIQSAAEQAVKLTDENSSLVAIDTATGNVLAVANGPADKAGEDRALNGQYAPGTAFKMISALALLQSGLGLNDKIGCPPSVTIDGKRFDNYDNLGGAGQISLSTNFARSCNTAFARRVADLKPDALSTAAQAFGIGGAWDLLLDAFPGSVPPASDKLELANSALGQGRVLMSPLAMAVVAAAISSGTPHYPRLVLDGPPPQQGPPPNPAIIPPPGTVPSASPTPTPTPGPTPVFTPEPDDRPVLAALPFANELRAIMRLAVNRGTADILNVGPGIGGTSGTALYGSETEPGRHAWMVGYNGPIAFAVVVERGTSGPATAGPLARSFLSAIL